MVCRHCGHAFDPDVVSRNRLFRTITWLAVMVAVFAFFVRSCDSNEPGTPPSYSFEQRVSRLQQADRVIGIYAREGVIISRDNSLGRADVVIRQKSWRRMSIEDRQELIRVLGVAAAGGGEVAPVTLHGDEDDRPLSAYDPVKKL